MSASKLNWRFIDEDGLPPLDSPVIVYRPAATAIHIMGSDIRKGEFGGRFAHTPAATPVVAWILVAELMETLP